jgi:hypothetical protein
MHSFRATLSLSPLARRGQLIAMMALPPHYFRQKSQRLNMRRFFAAIY